MTQQARQLIWELDDSEADFRFLIRDNDTKFMPTFDTVFETEGIHVIPTPFQAPNANAHAERWVRTVREECLDHILVLNEKHLKRVLDEFVADYYNVARPHQGIGQQFPISNQQPVHTGAVQCRKLLGGIINDYYRTPTSSVARNC